MRPSKTPFSAAWMKAARISSTTWWSAGKQLPPKGSPAPISLRWKIPRRISARTLEDTSSISGSQDSVIKVPILGYIDLSKLSLGVSTALIALVDGFNPCSLWALSMLLAITIHTGSRKKVFIIGMVFITVTALIYALFIAGLFSVLKLTGLITWMRVVVFIIAAILGVINIKDYFWFKEGVSLTIDDSKRKGILQRMRELLDGSQSTGSLIGATILLAGGVSLVEFSCTAGLPVLWTNLLNAQGVATATFICLLLSTW